MRVVYLAYLCVYIATGAAQSLLVKKSAEANGGKQPYEPAAVTFSTELLKLTISAAMIFLFTNRDQSAKSKLLNLLSKWETARQFAVPAALYSVFNVLMFYNLRLVSPPTYRLLINLKVLFSGLLLQGLIGTKLTRRQWAGLCILVLACGVEQWDSFDMETGLAAIISICIQAFCSSFAGVYFQLLLQFRPAAAAGAAAAPVAPGSELGLWEKNLFMYCWTILFNIVYIAIMNPAVLADPAKAASTMDAQVVPIILMSGLGGVSTSLILRDMDVIVKEYANFAEMMVVVLGSWMLLGTQLRSTLFLAVMMVTASLYLYNIPATAPAPVAVPMDDLEKAVKDEPRPLLTHNDRERTTS